jgi:hypothetical protein
MASDAQETLFRIFAALSGTTAGSVGGGVVGAVVDAATGSTTAGGGSTKASTTAEAGGGSTKASTTAEAGGGAIKASKAAEAGGGSTVESIAMDVLKSGLGVVPLVTTLFGLFGGGGEAEAPPPMVKYALPERVNFQAAETAAGFAAVDYDQAGMPRAYAASSGVAAGVPQVQVTVNAMDARSFLDRSSEIAAAVREAMLNLNSINDVVNDL